MLTAKFTFYLPRLFLWSFNRWYSSNNCFYKALENFLKLENSPLKVSTSLSSPSRTSHCDTKSISFHTKACIAKDASRRPWLLTVLKPCVSNSRGAAPGCTNAPPPEQTTWTNAPGLPGGWTLEELTDVSWTQRYVQPRHVQSSWSSSCSTGS